MSSRSGSADGTGGNTLLRALRSRFGCDSTGCSEALGEITMEVPAGDLLSVAVVLKQEPQFAFQVLVDLCGVDYSTYGRSEWVTTEASSTGFGRGVERDVLPEGDSPRRFAVIYHLLSLEHNQRLRLRVFAEGSPPIVDSVTGIWACANWYEREAFDLFGILFRNHPDLRRILTDYGFVGHPFRKDFPLSGHVEMRYDAELKRVIYVPVSIEPLVLVPRVIRNDSRYVGVNRQGDGSNA